MTKLVRLLEALRSTQKADRCANGVLHFVKYVMDPVRHTGNRAYYETKRAGERPGADAVAPVMP